MWMLPWALCADRGQARRAGQTAWKPEAAQASPGLSGVTSLPTDKELRNCAFMWLLNSGVRVHEGGAPRKSGSAGAGLGPHVRPLLTPHHRLLRFPASPETPGDGTMAAARLLPPPAGPQVSCPEACAAAFPLGPSVPRLLLAAWLSVSAFPDLCSPFLSPHAALPLPPPVCHGAPPPSQGTFPPHVPCTHSVSDVETPSDLKPSLSF